MAEKTNLFPLPYPMKTWSLDAIKDYVTENGLTIENIDTFTEETKATLCLDIKEAIDKAVKENKENKEEKETKKEKDVKEVTADIMVSVTPNINQKFFIGGVTYNLRNGIPVRVPRTVARQLSNAGVLKYTM